ncbi:MAG: SCO family protein [Pseudomonadota bacterium]
MERLVSIRIRVLIGFVAFLSVCFFAWSAPRTPAKNQTELFSQNSGMSSLNKVTGLPDPGTYKLQKIFKVPNLSVLDTKGKLQPISKYTTGKMTLLTFFYERCSDVNGCPYVVGLFHGVKNKLEKDPNIRDSVRFVSISFDPQRDTPMMLAGLEKRASGVLENKKSVEWDYLTTASIEKLMPVIDGFGQNVDVQMSPNTGNKSLTYSHVLKVFLIDGEGYVREIYSTSYLSQTMLLNDIQTLMAEKK